MHQLDSHPSLLAKLKGQTALITGSARGIGGATASLFNKHGANVVIVDLPYLQGTAEELLESFKHPENALFVPASVTEWDQMVQAFEDGIEKFGRIDIVVANAGVMESKPVLDVESDENGRPLESKEGIQVIDVNLKGALNTLRLGIWYLGKNTPSQDEYRGAITLVSSTSGYFGTTGNAAYIASKHGVVGLLRASQKKASSLKIRVNSIAPCYTPTFITAAFGDGIQRAGIEANTPEGVGSAIAYASIDEQRQGTSCLVAGKYLRELEHTQKSMMSDWLGQDLVDMLSQFGEYLASIGGYRLPPSRPQ